MGTYVVAADMFSDRINGKLIRGVKGQTVEVPDDHPNFKGLTGGDRPVLMSESAWKKLQEGDDFQFGGVPDSEPSGATAGIVTTGVQADVPTPEQAARQRHEDEKAADSEKTEETTSDNSPDMKENAEDPEKSANAGTTAVGSDEEKNGGEVTASSTTTAPKTSSRAKK